MGVVAEQVSEDHVYPKRDTSLRHHNLPWLNKDIFQYMKRRNNLFRKANRLPEVKLKYSRLRNKVLSQLSLTKEEYFRKLDPCNPKQFRKTVKILNKQGPFRFLCVIIGSGES